MLHQPYQSNQKSMLEEIEDDLKSTAHLTGIDSFSSKVLNAFEQVPRHLFVKSSEEEYAYLNTPLPIGHGQTISQPFIVALMTELLDVKETDRVLEIGTGSGYQAAILSKLAKDVYTIEVVPQLAKQAQERFKNLNYQNIHTRIDNGNKGWPEFAPYDKIIATASAKDVPLPLIMQLKAGGRMVIPLGSQGTTQELTLIRKNMDNTITQSAILPVSFVPFV